MVLYILGYKQPHAAPPGAPRITRSRASPCPPAAPPDPAAAYTLGYMDGFQMWRSGSPRRSHSAAAVTPSAPKPRTLSQCSRHDIPARPAVRTPPFPSRRSRPAVPVTPLTPKPRAPSQCSRHDVPARPAARTPPPPSRHSRQSLALRPSVRATTSRLVPPFALRRPCHAVRAPAACAASRVAHRASPRSPSNRSDPRFL